MRKSIFSDTYVLNTSVSSADTCFNVTVANVMIDCNGFTINYSSSSNGSGVYSTNTNTTVKNCIINQTNSFSNSHGIYFNGASYGLIQNNNITTSGSISYGVYTVSSNYVNISRNSITTLRNIQWDEGYGIYTYSSTGSIISSNNINITRGLAIHMHYPGNNIIYNNNITVYNGEAGFGAIDYYGGSNENISYNNILVVDGNQVYGIGISSTSTPIIISNNHIATNGASNNYGIKANSNQIILNSVFSTIAGGSDIYLDGGVVNLTNCTFNKAKVSLSGTAAINVFWLADVYVNDTLGNAVSGANVTSQDVNNNFVNWTLTNPSGWTSRLTLKEYMRNTTSTYYITNYTMNASRNGYETTTQKVNLTSSRTNPNSIVLTETHLPTYVYLYYPNNNAQINDTQNLNFTFNVTGNLSSYNCSIHLDNVLNQTNSSVLNNTNTNFTISGIAYGDHQWYVDCNDINSQVQNFSIINTQDPVAYQGNPIDNYNSTYDSITFDLKCTDNIAVDAIQLWTNSTGTWQADYSNLSYANDTWLNITLTGIPDGVYAWAVYCNATAKNSNWTGNRTFNINSNKLLQIDYPSEYTLFQRDNSTTGIINIIGHYNNTLYNVTAIEASFNRGSWTVINSSPSGGKFSGNLSGTIGQGNLLFRASNNYSIPGFSDTIAIGDLYAIGGQSNALGEGEEYMNVSDSLMYLPIAFNESNKWQIANDPIYASTTGSCWPLVANYLVQNQSVPIGFIQNAVGSSAISAWIDGTGNYVNMINRISVATNGTMKVKSLLFFQGERDTRGVQETILHGI